MSQGLREVLVHLGGDSVADRLEGGFDDREVGRKTEQEEPLGSRLLLLLRALSFLVRLDDGVVQTLPLRQLQLEARGDVLRFVVLQLLGLLLVLLLLWRRHQIDHLAQHIGDAGAGAVEAVGVLSGGVGLQLEQQRVGGKDCLLGHDQSAGRIGQQVRGVEGTETQLPVVKLDEHQRFQDLGPRSRS